MLLGIVLGVAAYLVSHRTSSSLTQGDAITIGLGGVTVSVVGAAIFLRYSLTGFLRFWMARQSFELNVLAERLTSPAPLPSPRQAGLHDFLRVCLAGGGRGTEQPQLVQPPDPPHGPGV